MLPNRWGQGQLFAFSALDGESFAGDDLCGTLMGDRIGIRFYLKTKRELSFVKQPHGCPEFEAVTGDLIKCRFANGKTLKIVFSKRNLIVGVTGGAYPIVFTEGPFDATDENGCEIVNTLDGDFTALKREGDKFAFAFAHTKEDAVSLAEEGMKADIASEEAKKTAYYEKNGLSEGAPYAKLFAKCLSVMKTQLYSPEKEFDTVWSTPDRLPHRHLWLWDSVFHAVGHRHQDAALAQDLIRAIWVHQGENGYVPHMADLGMASGVTQPPVIAWGALKVFEKSGNMDFLKEVFEKNARFLKWCERERRKSDAQLYTWKTTIDKNCRCDECGMDNSPRFDTLHELYAIDFTCFMANDVRSMAEIADILGKHEEASFYRTWFENIRDAVNNTLWSEEDGFYFDYDIEDNRLHKVWSVASFLPLFAGLCSDKQAKALIAHLNDPESFKTEMPIPSISVKDKTFGSDMWRGPVWINYNVMISEGLNRYGENALADEIIDKTVFHMNKWYEETGTIFEFYDSVSMKTPKVLNRKGVFFEPYGFEMRMQSIRDYGWSCTLLCDILKRKYGN